MKIKCPKCKEDAELSMDFSLVKCGSCDFEMSCTCTKCKNSIPDNEELGIVAEKYPTCNKCWAEWKEYQVMVMNEMKLDMSMLDHRKLLKKHEKIFVGVLSPEGEVIDYSNEDNRKPDEPTGA